MSAAFDTIDTSTLLRRLRYTFGVSGPALSWIASYLVSRKQSVRVGEEQSSTTACEYGVPQGSVLGPLLFSLYMSPIARVIGSFGIEHAQYADDTQLYVALTDANTLPNLADCFHAVHRWLDLNGLSLNPDKTEAMVIGTNARQRVEEPITAVDIGTVCIPVSRCVKSLGITIDDTLSFSQHVNDVVKSSSFHLRALRHIRRWISEDTAKSIATAAVAGRLDYCNSVLYGSSAANIQRLQRVQNSFARVVTRARRSEHITPVLAKLHWLPIQYRIQFKLALITFKAITTRTPHYLSELVRPYEPSRQLRPRRKNLLQQERIKLAFSGRAFRHSAPSVWNNLPKSVISDISISLHPFKSRLKSELYSRAFRH